MIIRYALCFFLGYMTFQWVNPAPVTVETVVEQREAPQEPTYEDLKRGEFLKECSKYGFTKTKCESIWDGEKI